MIFPQPDWLSITVDGSYKLLCSDAERSVEMQPAADIWLRNSDPTGQPPGPNDPGGVVAGGSLTKHRPSAAGHGVFLRSASGQPGEVKYHFLEPAPKKKGAVGVVRGRSRS